MWQWSNYLHSLASACGSGVLHRVGVSSGCIRVHWVHHVGQANVLGAIFIKFINHAMLCAITDV